MSTPDTRVPFISAPLLNHVGEPNSVTPLPGLRAEAIQGLESSFPGTLSTAMRTLLSSSCGLARGQVGQHRFHQSMVCGGTAGRFPLSPVTQYSPVWVR